MNHLIVIEFIDFKYCQSVHLLYGGCSLCCFDNFNSIYYNNKIIWVFMELNWKVNNQLLCYVIFLFCNEGYQIIKTFCSKQTKREINFNSIRKIRVVYRDILIKINITLTTIVNPTYKRLYHWIKINIPCHLAAMFTCINSHNISSQRTKAPCL